MPAQVPRRPRALSTTRVPRIERRRRLGKDFETTHRIDKISVGVGAPQVFAPQSQARLAGKPARTVAETSGVSGCSFIGRGVDDRAGELGVMGPRAPIEVVGTDHEPYVVNHADLRVHVNRREVGILQVVHGDAITTGAAQDLDHALADSPGRSSVLNVQRVAQCLVELRAGLKAEMA